MSEQGLDQESQIMRAVETAIRLGAIFLLAMWVFDIIRPFVSPILWGIIIAVAAYPVYGGLVRLCGGRTTLGAVLFSLLGIVLLVTPTVMLTGSLVEWVDDTVEQIENGTITIPPPPAGVAEWPIVGEDLHYYWTEASERLQEAARTPGIQLETATRWLVSSTASAASGVLQFVLSILIAGAVLANSTEGSRLVNRLFVRLAPGLGGEFAKLSEQTVRSVATGVIGVAVIQSILVGIGLFAIGAPAAPLIVLFCMIMAIVQLPVLIVVLPVIIWAWGATDTVPALLFTIWTVAAAVSDNVLKPILLGRGVKAPMLVIFLGAIGGFIASGIIGLFVGAVILVLAYELFTVWLDRSDEADTPVEVSL